MNRMDELISRQAAIDAIYACYIGGKEAVDKAPYSDHYAEGIDEAVNAVEELPSVSTEKTGRWIDRFPLKECKCSECDYLIMLSFGSFSEVVKQMKYCPNCGCFMKGDNDERS